MIRDALPATAADRVAAVPRRGHGHAGVQQIYEDLRERIVSVVLEPGAGLSEARIAEQYGVSRTPVREAFKRLAEDGFLDVIPQVGTYVARIDLGVVQGNLFVRETLECRIAELAASRIDAGGKQLLRSNLGQQRAAIEARDAAGFFRADEALHRLLASIAGQPGAWSIVHAAKSQLDRVRRLSLDDHSRMRTRWSEHRDIVDRVDRGDGDGAADAMRRHVRSALDAITEIATLHAAYFTPFGRTP